MKIPGEWAAVYGLAMTPEQFAALVRAIQADALEAALTAASRAETHGDACRAIRALKPAAPASPEKP